MKNPVDSFLVIIFGIVITLFIWAMAVNISTSYSESTEIDTVTAKVIYIPLPQQIQKGDANHNITTEIRYLVLTDKETFVIKNSLLNGKYNNSDIYFRLVKDSTYTFRVCGRGKGLYTDYRNILEIIE
jgi:hypothetical protein